MAAATDKIKVLVLGDSGVGKTSLVHLICHNEALRNGPWTIGASVDVRLHEFQEGTPNQKSYFIELWDIGGSRGHFIARQILFQNVHGIILVHDLTNSKSHVNLRKWLNEVFCQRDLVREPTTTAFSFSALLGAPPSFDDIDFDPEAFAGKDIPVLVVGTKVDQAAPTPTRISRSSSIAQECSAEEILVDTNQTKSLAPASTNAVKLSRFFDKVIERKYNAYKVPSFAQSSYNTSRNRNETTLFMPSKLSHLD